MAEDKAPPATDDASEGVESKGEEQRVPYSRFKEVTDRLKAYAELGTPEQIAAVIDDYPRLAEALKRQEQSASEQKPQPTAKKIPDEKRPEILAQLNDLVGGDLRQLIQLIPTIQDTKQQVDGASEMRLNQLRATAAAKVASLAKAEGYSAESVDRIEKLVASRVYGEPDLAKRFFNGDMSVVDEAFASENRDFFSTNMVKPLKAKRSSDLSLLNGNEGRTTEKPAKSLSAEEIAKLPPQQRSRAIGNLAWDYYNARVADKEEAVE